MIANRSGVVALIDMDFALYKKYLYQGIFAHHTQNKFKRHYLVFFYAYHFPMYLHMKLGLISKEYLYSQHAANLAWLVRGVPIDQADTIWDWVLENEIIPYLRPEMIEIINENKRKGHSIMLSSGSFSPLLEKVVTYLDIEGSIATPLGEKEGKYADRIFPPLKVGQGKVDLLKQFLDGPGKEFNLDKSYYYTDSFVDLPVMKMFGNPVAVFPDEYLAKIARLQDWPIIGVEHQFG